MHCFLTSKCNKHQHFVFEKPENWREEISFVQNSQATNTSIKTSSLLIVWLGID